MGSFFKGTVLGGRNLRWLVAFIHAQKTEQQMLALLAMKLGSPAHNKEPPTFRMCFPVSISPVYKLS